MRRRLTDSTMKTLLAAFILLTGFTSFGQDASDITTRVMVVDPNQDGKNVIRVETTYRGNTKVMVTTFRPNKKGVMALYSRTYFANGKATMVEEDDDGDGTLSHFAVFGQSKDDVEMFKRESDGTVKPVSSQALDTLKRQRAVMENLLQSALEEKKHLLEEERKDGR